MKVRMLVGISGGRGDGTPWPPAGGELHVSHEEGTQLCRGGLAVPLAEPAPPAETPEETLKAAEEERIVVPAAPPAQPARPSAARTRTAKPKG